MRTKYRGYGLSALVLGILLSVSLVFNHSTAHSGAPPPSYSQNSHNFDQPEASACTPEKLSTYLSENLTATGDADVDHQSDQKSWRAGAIDVEPTVTYVDTIEKFKPQNSAKTDSFSLELAVAKHAPSESEVKGQPNWIAAFA